MVIDKNAYFVHQLVALTFIRPKPEGDYSVDHIDRDKHNNKLENLHWATREKQADNSISKAVNAYKNGKFYGHYKSMMTASKILNISNKLISGVISGKTKTTGGYLFKLAEYPPIITSINKTETQYDTI